MARFFERYSLKKKRIQEWDANREEASQWGEKKVALRVPIVELNSVYNLSVLRDEQQTSGTGQIDDLDSEYEITHNAQGDFVRLTSSKRGRYQPGTTLQIGIAYRQVGKPTSGDLISVWGYFEMEQDENGNFTENIYNGTYFGLDTQGLFIEIVKNGISLRKVYKENWNINSDIEVDPTQNNIVYQIDINYYGAGLIVFKVVDAESGYYKQDIVTVHTERIVNETNLGNTNLKVGALIKSSNTDEVPDGGVITFCAQSVSGDSTVDAVCKMVEEF